MMRFFGGKKPQSSSNGMSSGRMNEQQAFAHFSEQIDNVYKRIDSINTKIEEQAIKIKELIWQEKQVEAKCQVRKYKMLQEQLAKFQNMLIMLENERIQLHSSLEMTEVIHTLRTGNNTVQDVLYVDARREEIEMNKIDRLEELDFKRDEKYTTALISELIEIDDEVENIYRDFEQEVMEEKMEKMEKMINMKINPITVNANIQNISEPTQQLQKSDDFKDSLQPAAQ